jgi:hypothetical protein
MNGYSGIGLTLLLRFATSYGATLSVSSVASFSWRDIFIGGIGVLDKDSSILQFFSDEIVECASQVLFFGAAYHCATVFATMTGVKDNNWSHAIF